MNEKGYILNAEGAREQKRINDTVRRLSSGLTPTRQNHRQPAGRSATEGVKGSFDVKIVGGTALEVYNSSITGGTAAGNVYVDQLYEVSACTFGLNQGNYIFVMVKWHGESGYDITIVNSSTLPTYSIENPVFYEVLCRVIKNTSGNYTLEKFRLPGDIRVIGRWV